MTQDIMPRPFIKWAGGKSYLLPRIQSLLSTINCNELPYYEPMVGGGAVYFNIANQFREAHISDVNTELINLYQIVKTMPQQLITELTEEKYSFHHKSDPNSRDTYLSIRIWEPNKPIEVAARTMYLLKTCFNGLMGVNKSGKFNVPMGSYTDPKICDRGLLMADSDYMQDTYITLGDISQSLQSYSEPGFLFIDPPYHSDTKKFINYSGQFSPAQQRELIRTLLDSNHKFIYTNRATEFIIGELGNISMDIIPLRHSIQPKHTKGVVEEEVVAYRL